MPNWPDGSYFWMAAPAGEGNSLYVIGERISRSAGAVEGEYTARFTVGADDARLLAEIIASRYGPGLKESCAVSHLVSGREVRSMSDLIPAPSAYR